ncbi:hypothetical protein GLOIN_2v1886648 [Rhizophagus clarus]|uniref:CxC2-like cysteine cluster KDZ transposase-associated domain-containing protein n=1 Tax=Rhizophagus clarus TaxID=94130 RepID=A0A8H3LWJ3_9GLOM|nr:hypothetical protein GLOIN_2v1886648 [Rhizophagus clarus]
MNKGISSRKGKMKYKSYLVSSNKKNARKVVINRYAKGNNKYRITNKFEKPVNNSDEMLDDEITNKNEWMDIDISEDEEFNSIKNTYKNAQKFLSENWKKISSKISNIMIENNAIDENSKCIRCGLPAICRCLDCGSNVYFCLKCSDLFHKDINLFHRKLSMNNNICEETVKLPQLCMKNCEHEIKEILVINLKGAFKVEFPVCEGKIDTLIRHKLFPSTPVNPQVAFPFVILDIYQELLLEAHVPYLSFCQVLESLFYNQNITKNIYYLFKSAFHQYLGLKTMIENTIIKLFDNKSRLNCPACPLLDTTLKLLQPEEKNSKVIIALDANFQLKRMKSAGSDIGERLIDELFILNQNKYDDWAQSSINIRSSSNNINNILGKNYQTSVCNNHFKAADQTRANIKSNYLNDTGIFGSTCRHGIPLKFINLKEIGERFSLAKFLLLDLQNLFNEDSSTFIVLYDIACRLHSYVERNESSLFSSRYRFDWGFASTTKYMRPCHRLDILEKAIQHVSQKMINNLAYTLVKRLKNAKKIMNESSNILKEIQEEHGVDENTILYCIQYQKESDFVFKQHLVEDEKYFSYLMELHRYEEEISHTNSERSLESLKKSRSSCVKKIEKCETDLDIAESKRWNPFDPNYFQYLYDYCKRNLDLIVDKLKILRNEYIFKNSQLYNRDHKGYKLALKIKSNIGNISKQIELNIVKYSYFKSLIPEGLLCENYPEVTFKEIINHTSNFWKILVSTDDKIKIPRIVIFNSIKNSKEEIILIKQELDRLHDFWINQKLRGMIYILSKYYRYIIKNLENHQDALRQIDKENNVLVDFPIYDIINEIEEDNILKGNLEENLRELEIFIDKENANYEKKNNRRGKYSRI